MDRYLFADQTSSLNHRKTIIDNMNTLTRLEKECVQNGTSILNSKDKRFKSAGHSNDTPNFQNLHKSSQDEIVPDLNDEERVKLQCEEMQMSNLLTKIKTELEQEMKQNRVYKQTVIT